MGFAERATVGLAALGQEVPILQFVPWWVALPCLLASALAAWLALRGARPWWQLVPLVAVLSPVVLAGAMVAAVSVSVLLPAVVGDAYGALVGLWSGR